MTQWSRVNDLFHAALARAGADREAFLGVECGRDTALRHEVESLLAAHDANTPSTSGSLLAFGTRVGDYEITGFLAAGAMGEVYRARDTRLEREVALKILPAAFVNDPDRRARFEREARVLASLNHPNIATIYGFEEGPAEAGHNVHALALELVEGETLAERIVRGRIPLDEVLRIARQIAEALEAAHEQGIIHRDLKPANIKLTRDGVVKVLDFGLAKLTLPEGEVGTTAPSTVGPGMTGARVLLGTPAYMSPEQARGQPVDRRTDIWAFGCVLFEMLTARPAFPGATLSDTIAAVLDREPDWQTLPDATPAGVRRLLERCLDKDPKRRLHHIADARIEIEDVLSRAMRVEKNPVATISSRGSRERLRWIAVGAISALAVAALAIGATGYFRSTPTETRAAYRSSILLPAGVSVPSAPTPSARFALSPDGRRLAFIGAEADGVSRLWVQSLDGLSAQALPGTEGAVAPFWSPDSRFIGFRAAIKLKRIESTGGEPLTLADARGVGGTTWNRAGVILFGAINSPILRVSASGGTVSPVTTLNAEVGETAHTLPFFLPDGRHFLYMAVGSKTTGPSSPSGIYVASLDSNERKLLVSGGSSVVYAEGYLLFLRGQTLMAQRFDVERLELTGDAVPITEQVATGGASGGSGGFSVSETGVLAYQTGPAEIGALAGGVTQLVWFDRNGKQISLLGEQARSADVELGPDGTRAAVSVFDLPRRTRDIWLLDVARGLRTRFTFDTADESLSVWSPDGNRLVFNGRRKEHYDLYLRASSGAGAEEELLADNFDKYPLDWSSDGRFLLYGLAHPQTRFDLWVLPLVGDRKASVFLNTPFSEGPGQFSPDGRWIAYVSNESGRSEVYVAPFPGPGGKWQVSILGGDWPRWRRDGREIFYLAPDNKLMAATVNGQGSAFAVGAVKPLFDVRPSGSQTIPRSVYDVSPDGQRFLINTIVAEAASAPITLVVNWPALLSK